MFLVIVNDDDDDWDDVNFRDLCVYVQVTVVRHASYVFRMQH